MGGSEGAEGRADGDGGAGGSLSAQGRSGGGEPARSGVGLGLGEPARRGGSSDSGAIGTPAIAGGQGSGQLAEKPRELISGAGAAGVGQASAPQVHSGAAAASAAATSESTARRAAVAAAILHAAAVATLTNIPVLAIT
jgi:hypothetical protein